MELFFFLFFTVVATVGMVLDTYKYARLRSSRGWGYLDRRDVRYANRFYAASMSFNFFMYTAGFYWGLKLL